MATIDTLASGANPELVPITVPLSRRQLPQRLIYGFPEFIDWINETLPTLTTGRLRSHMTPQDQLQWIFDKWIAGKTIRYEKMFSDLTPRDEEVWELKTPDIRIFGWIYKPCFFIAVFGDYADHYKHPTQIRTYNMARMRVVNARERLNLDEPKLARGVFDDLVSV